MGRQARFLALIVFAAILSGAPAYAGPSQGQLFRQAWSAIHRGQTSRAGHIMEHLHGYVLYPYLVFARLDRRIRRLPGAFSDDPTVARFLKAHADWPIAAPLRDDWLRSLAYRKRWAQFLKYYRGSNSSGLRCDAINARLHADQPARRLTGPALQLWLHGYSQPRQCDPVFAWLKKRGLLTPKRIRRRLDLALDDAHFHLALYLAERLPRRQRARQRRRIRLYAHPHRELTLAARRTAPLLPAHWVAHAVQRLAASAPDKAIGLLHRLDHRYRFTTTERQNMARRIAEGLAWDHQAKALAWFARIKQPYNTATSRQWRVRAALYQQRWQQALRWIARLPSDQRARPQWRYWRARALAATGRHHAAEAVYRRLAGGDGYYALLAADHMDQPYRFDSHPVVRDPALQRRIARLPGIVRAHELFSVDLPGYARAEWRAALAGRPATWYRQAALVAQRWGWVDESIRSLVRGGAGNDLRLRYPTAFASLVMHQARSLSLQASWIYGIMRTESLFSPHAESSTGARGLMQLMPGTARDVARRMGLHLREVDALFTPRLNVRLGSHYLQRMTQRFDGSLVAATAAYNAGPRRVSEWLPRHATAADLWVDNIPYGQTRRYVKRVMAYTAIFYWRLHHRTKPLSAHMSPIPPIEPEVVASRR